MQVNCDTGRNYSVVKYRCLECVTDKQIDNIIAEVGGLECVEGFDRLDENDELAIAVKAKAHDSATYGVGIKQKTVPKTLQDKFLDKVQANSCSGGAQASVGAAISSLETSSSVFETPKAQRVLKRACDLDATSPMRLSRLVCASETQRGLKRAYDREASSPVRISRLVWSPGISDFGHSSSVVVINDSDSESGFDGTACPSGVASSVLETFDASSGSFSLTTAGEHVAMVGASSIESSGVSIGSCSSSVTAVSVHQTVSPDAASSGSGPRRSARIASSLGKRTARLSESSQLGRGVRSIARSID